MVRSGEFSPEINVVECETFIRTFFSQAAVNQHVNVNPKNHWEPTVPDETCSELLGDARYSESPSPIGLAF